MLRWLPVLLGLTSLLGCDSAPASSPEYVPEPDPITLRAEPFGETPDGPATLFTLDAGKEGRVRITNYGGIVTHLLTPDRAGRLGDIVLGYDSLGGYLAEHPYFGAIVGRVGNRVARATFDLDGETYTLVANDGVHSLHGGETGFDDRLWTADTFRRGDTVGVVLNYRSPAGEEGYPGTLDATVTYSVTPLRELIIDYAAVTDAPTPVNLTNHSYFNLRGRGDVLNHELRINADTFTPVDRTLIPTGERLPVAGTPFDFRTARPIGERINVVNAQLRYGLGYDHNFILNGSAGELRTAAEVHDPVSGRQLTILTTEPGLQFYSGNFLDGTLSGKGRTYNYRNGLVLETQHFPDSPNQDDFPTVTLRPGDTLRSRTVWRW